MNIVQLETLDRIDNIEKPELKSKNIIIDLYQYYFYNGFNNILIEKSIHLLISYLLIFLINFLINCIQYNELIYLDNELIIPPHQTIHQNLSSNTTKNTSTYIYSIHKSIYDYIDMSEWFPKNPYLIICFILYCIYLISISLNFFITIKKFWKIRKIYNQCLKINDYRLKFITWDEIVNNIIQRTSTNTLLDASKINIYTINNQICHQSNIIIAMIRNKYIIVNKLSKFLEWNYIFCIIEPMTIIKKHNSHLKYEQLHENSILEDLLDNVKNMNTKQIVNNMNEPLLSDTNTYETSQNNIIFHTQNTQNTQNNQQTEQYINQSIIEIENQQYNYNYNLNDISISSGSRSHIPTQISETSLQNNIPTSENTLENTSRNIYHIPLNLTSRDNNYVSNSLYNQNNFDNILFNTFMNQSVINGDISELSEYIKKVHYRINLAIIINTIAMPFIIIILLVYLMIKYGEKMYVNPMIMFKRKINKRTMWKLRYYNELPNAFKTRINRIECNMDKIMNLYRSPTREIVIRFLLFAFGSIFIILLVLSFIANEEFSNLEIINGHNVIWFLGIMGTLLIILNKCLIIQDTRMTNQEQIFAFDSLREDLITIYPNILNVNDREYLVQIINEIYQQRIVYVMYELMYLITTPYYLWKWKKQINLNCNKILEVIEYHHILGNVCKYSIFSNGDELTKNPHMLLSFKEFHLNHPEWAFPVILGIDLDMQNSEILKYTIFK
jgi:hypothetical protein